MDNATPLKKEKKPMSRFFIITNALLLIIISVGAYYLTVYKPTTDKAKAAGNCSLSGNRICVGNSVSGDCYQGGVGNQYACKKLTGDYGKIISGCSDSSSTCDCTCPNPYTWKNHENGAWWCFDTGAGKCNGENPYAYRCSASPQQCPAVSPTNPPEQPTGPTSTPVITNTPTPTPTGIIPTSSPTPTPTIILTVTPTLTATPTPTTPPGQPTSTPGPTATPIPVPCGTKNCDDKTNPCRLGYVCVQGSDGSNYCSGLDLTEACKANPSFVSCCTAPGVPTATSIPTTTIVRTKTASVPSAGVAQWGVFGIIGTIILVGLLL
jgi:hypothetical protein